MKLPTGKSRKKCDCACHRGVVIVHVVPCCGAPVFPSVENQKSPPTDSIWKLRLDVTTAKILVWSAKVGRDADLTPNTHLYFADRYQRIADYHRKRGNQQRAVRLQAKAFQHYKLGGGDKGDGPLAAAMGMPRPRQWVITNAVSGRDPDDAA